MESGEQGCGTGKFEDGSGSNILSDYGSGSGSRPGSGSYMHIHILYMYEYRCIHICERIRKRICIHILKHTIIQYIGIHLHAYTYMNTYVCTYS
jgi:hypothetical protein